MVSWTIISTAPAPLLPNRGGPVSQAASGSATGGPGMAPGYGTSLNDGQAAAVGAVVTGRHEPLPAVGLLERLRIRSRTGQPVPEATGGSVEVAIPGATRTSYPGGELDAYNTRPDAQYPGMRPGRTLVGQQVTMNAPSTQISARQQYGLLSRNPNSPASIGDHATPPLEPRTRFSGDHGVVSHPAPRLASAPRMQGNPAATIPSPRSRPPERWAQRTRYGIGGVL